MAVVFDIVEAKRLLDEHIRKRAEARMLAAQRAVLSAIMAHLRTPAALETLQIPVPTAFGTCGGGKLLRAIADLNVILQPLGHDAGVTHQPNTHTDGMHNNEHLIFQVDWA